jgi:YcxB-like protein
VNLTYQPRFEDYFHGVMYGFWGTPARALKSGLLSLVFGVALIAAFWHMRLPLHWYAIIGVGAGAAWAAFFTLVFGAWLAGSLMRRDRAKGETQIIVSDEGVERKLGASTVSLKWSGISHVDETTRLFMLYDAERPVFSIEKSALASAEDLRALRNFLRQRKPGSFYLEGDA